MVLKSILMNYRRKITKTILKIKMNKKALVLSALKQYYKL